MNLFFYESKLLNLFYDSHSISNLRVYMTQGNLCLYFLCKEECFPRPDGSPLVS